MDPKEMVQDAEALAQLLLTDAEEQGMDHATLLQILGITLRLLRATYPGTVNDVYNLMQLADANFELAVAGSSKIN